MLAQSCFLGLGQRQLEFPDVIVLPGDQLLREFRENIRNLPVTPTLTFDDEQLMRFVLSCIAYDKDAEFSLAHDALEIAHSTTGLCWSADVDAVVTAAVNFGTAFVNQLRALHAYRNGYLPYQFGRWLGRDVVLYRIDPPDPNW